MSQVYKPTLEKAWKYQIFKFVFVCLLMMALRSRLKLIMLWSMAQGHPWSIKGSSLIVSISSRPLPFPTFTPPTSIILVECVQSASFFTYKMDIMTLCAHAHACFRLT